MEPQTPPQPEEQPNPVPAPDQPQPGDSEAQPGVAMPDETLPTEASDAEPADTFTWEASEYVHHHKSAGWYMTFLLGVAILIGIATLTKQWFSIPVFVAMAAALLVYANKQPRVLRYSVGPGGIMIGDRSFPYNQFHSFSVHTEVGWHSIELEPTQRLMPRITMMFDDADLDHVLGILSHELPIEQREPDLVDRLVRYLKF